MARSGQAEIRMRLVVENPVAGVAHSLRDKKSHPVDVKVSNAGADLAFEFRIRMAAGPKLYGEQVRSEGPERPFIYVAIGQQAGDKASFWSRRMKIDIHRISAGTARRGGEGPDSGRDRRRNRQGRQPFLRHRPG